MVSINRLPVKKAVMNEPGKPVMIGMIALRNAGHLGRLGDWAEHLARYGLISFHFLNTPFQSLH